MTTQQQISPHTEVLHQPHPVIHRLPEVASREHLASGRVVEVLGEGGTSVVYQVWNEQLAIKRAVKLLKPNASRESHERFSQEMKILAQLSHPNIINVHSVGKWNNLPYIEMDYVDGPSLEALIEQKGRIPLVVAVAIAIEISKALDYSHRHRYRINNIEYHGLLHRDLKPANILLPRYDTVRLSDFGIATLSTVSTTSMTRTGKIIGSMQYLAPEQLEDKCVDHRSDIYSFGATLYELVTGSKLFPERNVSKLVRMRVKNEIVPITDHNVKMPAELERLINSCIAMNPNDRPASMKKVLTVLEQIYPLFQERPTEEVISRYLNGESVGSKIRKLSIRNRPHNPYKMMIVGGIAAILCMAMIFVAGLFWFGTQKNPAFMEEIRSAMSSSPISDDLQSAPGEPVKVNVVIRKMSQKSAAYSDKGVSLPESIPQTGDYAKDTLSVIQLQMQEMGFSDTLEALRELDRQEKYSRVLSLFPYLSHQMKKDKSAQLMRHRAVVGLGQESKNYYDDNNVNDGEYYLSKGLYLFNRQQYQRAIWIFRVAKTTPSQLVDARDIQYQALYLSAKCENALYSERSSEQRLAAVTTAWKAVKAALKNKTQDPHYYEAEQMLMQLSQEMKK